jgi:predicted 3-demethylubiquinone-9 3-methyltransferase (glyoxalase superfamily)
VGLEEIFADSESDRAMGAMEAMLKMGKLDIEALRAAADGAAAS